MFDYRIIGDYCCHTFFFFFEKWVIKGLADVIYDENEIKK